MIDIKDLTLDVKIGQMIMAGFPSKYYDHHVNEIIKDKKIGNIILFASNIGSIDDIIKLTSNLQKNIKQHIGIPGFISIDQEGGMVTRIYKGITFFPGNMAFSAANEIKSTFKQGEIEGKELKSIGINMNIAPVMDVNCNPKNPVIGCRSYGDNPKKVAEFGIGLIKGLEQSGVVAVAKHFPGHGDTDVDSHLSLPVVKHDMMRLEKIELIPFKSAIESGVQAIMSAHVLLPEMEPKKIPATLSHKVLTGLLKNKMGFNGLVITDCMEMEAIATYYGSEIASVMAINAGADIICISHTKEIQIRCVDAIKKAVLDGGISEERINQSVEKILEIKNKHNMATNEKFGTKKLCSCVENSKSREFAKIISNKSITVIKDNKKLLPVVGNIVSISTKAVVFTGVENEIKMNTPFCQQLKQKFGGKAFEIPLNPNDTLIEEIVCSCKNANVVIVGVYNASSNSKQIELVKKINSVNSNVILVSLRNPYDFFCFKNISTYINAYEYTELSISSVIKVISGEIKAMGISPIKLF